MRSRVSLRAAHKDMDVAAILERLTLQPQAYATAGCHRVLPRKGRFGAVSRITFASYVLGTQEGGEFDREMEAVEEVVSNQAVGIEVLVKKGVKFEIFVGLFPEINEEIEINHSLMSRLGKLQISVRLDIYPADAAA